MISATRPYNTAVILDESSGIWYCAYCQASATESTEIDHRDTYTYRNCSCELAEIERDIIMYVPPRRPLIDLEFVREIEYKNKLFKLNKEYNK